jgi:hypothetical protein
MVAADEEVAGVGAAVGRGWDSKGVVVGGSSMGVVVVVVVGVGARVVEVGEASTEQPGD